MHIGTHFKCFWTEKKFAKKIAIFHLPGGGGRNFSKSFWAKNKKNGFTILYWKFVSKHIVSDHFKTQHVIVTPRLAKVMKIDLLKNGHFWSFWVIFGHLATGDQFCDPKGPKTGRPTKTKKTRLINLGIVHLFHGQTFGWTHNHRAR